MSLSIAAMGAKVLATIGRKGERPDIYPARIVSTPEWVNTARGPQQFARIVMVATNLAGEQYLAERFHNIAFAFDRSEPVELLDGTRDHPKSVAELLKERNDAQLARIMALPESAPTVEVAALEL